jgi:hypothetical protein
MDVVARCPKGEPLHVSSASGSPTLQGSSTRLVKVVHFEHRDETDVLAA